MRILHLRQTRKAFSLIELLVAMGVVTLLIALILPAVQRARETARRTQCRNHLKQIGVGLHNYLSAHETFPISWGDDRFTDQARVASWLAMLLPYLDQAPMHRQIAFGAPLTADNLVIAATPVPAFLCPSDGGPAVRSDRHLAAGYPLRHPVAITNYRGVSGHNWHVGGFRNSAPSGRHRGEYDAFRFGNGIFTGGILEGAYWGPPVLTRPAHIRDGLGQTLAVGESVADWCAYSWWYWHNWTYGTTAMPINYCQDASTCHDDWQHNLGFHSRHSGGAHFLWADGRVQFLNESIDLAVYRALSSIDGGEVVSVP